MKKLIYLFLGLLIVACSSDNGGGGNDNLAIGQSYQGGKIFYIDSTGQHGLIAASEDHNGYLNWNDAMSYCADYTVGQYNDWFLPSKYELNLLYENKNAIGGFGGGYYWSSTESDNGYAWRQYFASGNQTSSNKDLTTNVRAVRAF